LPYSIHTSIKKSVLHCTSWLWRHTIRFLEVCRSRLLNEVKFTQSLTKDVCVCVYVFTSMMNTIFFLFEWRRILWWHEMKVYWNFYWNHNNIQPKLICCWKLLKSFTNAEWKLFVTQTFAVFFLSLICPWMKFPSWKLFSASIFRERAAWFVQGKFVSDVNGWKFKKNQKS